jgi:putative heme iron utilization protein
MKSGDDQAHAARQVLAGTFHGVLSTHSLEHAGYPFGSVVPYALNQDCAGKLSQGPT